MNVKVLKEQVEFLEKGTMTCVIVPKKEYKTGVEAHLTTGYGRNYNKVAVKKCVSTQDVYIEPNHSHVNSIIEIDGLILSFKEMKQLALCSGFGSLDAFFKRFNQSKDYTLIHFTNNKY